MVGVTMAILFFLFSSRSYSSCILRQEDAVRGCHHENDHYLQKMLQNKNEPPETLIIKNMQVNCGSNYILTFVTLSQFNPIFCGISNIHS